MAIQDDASLAMIPAAYGAAKLYSVIPSNGNGDFTFSRSGNATRVNKGGFIETMGSNVPRLDYPLIDGVVQDCPALLLEPSRTNLQIRSEEFDNSTWTKSNVSITADNIVSPNGSQTADLCNYTSSASYINSGFSSAGNTDVTVSVFVKANTVSTFRIRESFYIGSSCLFDLSAGSAGSGGTIQEYPNDWYRCTFTYTLGSGQTNINFIFDLNTNVGSVYLWGAQCELGSYPTSYIPTTTASVTRSADVCNGAGTSAEFNSTEGVIFLEIKPIALDGVQKRITLSDGTIPNRIIMGFDSSNNVLATVYDGSNQAVLGGNYSGKSDVQKVALKYKTNDFSLHFNGFKVAVDTIGNTFPIDTLDQFRFEDANGTLDFYGIAKQVMTFKTALTDSELEKITSWTSFSEMAKGQLYIIE